MPDIDVWCEMPIPPMHFMDFAKHKVQLGMGIACVWDMGGMLR
jgi:hypothetical protein